MRTATAAKRTAAINGVNVEALAAATDVAAANPAYSKFRFVLKNAWMGADRTRSTIKEFNGALSEHRTGVQAFVADSGQPEVLFGDDAAPSPSEWLLHALAACMTTTTACRAAAAGVAVAAIESEIEAEFDLDSFLGLPADDTKRRESIRVRMKVRTAAHPLKVEQFVMASPLLRLVSRSLPVNVSVETC